MRSADATRQLRRPAHSFILILLGNALKVRRDAGICKLPQRFGGILVHLAQYALQHQYSVAHVMQKVGTLLPLGGDEFIRWAARRVRICYAEPAP